MAAEWLKWVESCQAQRHGNYTLAGDYYEGRHRVKVPQKVRLWIEQNYSFRGNLSDVVVDALAERLVVTGFDCGDARMASVAWDWWRQNRMDHDSRVVHKEAAKYGDFYILVDWDPDHGRPRYTYQTPFQMYPRYVDRVLQYAVKVWDEDENTRRYNVYYADRVERFIAVRGRSLFGNAHGQPMPYGLAGQQVLDWTGRDGKPLGVPIVHFRNNAQSDDFGRAEAEQVIPIQDLLNKTLVDLALVMDTMGWPQRWATGPTPFGHEWSAAPGRVWKSDDPDAKFGQFDAADPKGLLDTLLFLVNFAAGRSRTPQHLFHISGEYPTGEALKTAEAGFIAKVEDRATAFGTYWEQVNHLAFRLDNAFGTGRWDAAQVMDTLWRPYELRNEQAHAQAIATLSGFYPRKALWRMNGATPADIVKLEQEWAEQQKADQEAAQAASQGFLSAFDRGDA
jgi:hypothetical protein